MLSSRGQLAVRGAATLALIVTGYCAVTRSLAVALSQRDPVLALSVSHSDARVKANAAQQLMQRAATDADRRQAKLLAEEAFAQDGTAVPAATTLALLAAVGGDSVLSKKWFAYAERLSRRDLPTQLFFIENYVSNGDIAGALHHYDIALRTSSERAPAVLYPILRNAITDDAVRHELAKTLAARPIWTENFVADLVNTGPNYVATAQLLVEARRRGAVFSRGLDDGLLDMLIRGGELPTAWHYYVATHPGAGRQPLRNTSFVVDGAGNSPFEWQVVAGDGMSASLGAADNGRTLEYRLSPTVGGPIVNQIVLLPGGKYRLSSTLTAASQDVGSGPYWQIRCIDSRPIAMLELGGPIERLRTFSTEFVVPSNCRALNLTLIGRSSDDIQGATGNVSSVSIVGIQ